MSRTATAENAADHEIIVVATMPYDFQLALTWDVSTPRDYGVILFFRHMI